MSYLRPRTSRRDESESPIREALHKCGWHTWTELPVDLLCWHPVHGFQVLEAKTGKRKTRRSQIAQGEFIRLTGCPVANTAEAAINALRGPR